MKILARIIVISALLIAASPSASAADILDESSGPSAEAEASGSAVAAFVQQGSTRFSSGGYRGPQQNCSWNRNPTASYGTHTIGNQAFKIVSRYDCATLADQTFLIPIGDPEQTLLPALISHVKRQLPAPEPVITPLRPQGWVLVQVAMDFRATPDTWQPITATAQINAGPQTLWATITATPETLELIPADPRHPNEKITCTGDEALAPYDWETPGACSYTYRNSSATAPNGKEFPAQLQTTWNITYQTSTGSNGTRAIDPTITERPIAVAEVKTYVTCIGNHCNKN